MDGDAGADLDEIRVECARIGFDMRELGGLAISDENALTAFRDLLHEIPSGVGLDEFLDRMRRQGFDLRSAVEELRELEADEERTMHRRDPTRGRNH